jgi:hypothetical protein
MKGIENDTCIKEKRTTMILLVQVHDFSVSVFLLFFILDIVI